MATISAATTERIYTIGAFRGLHENPDGDTKLKPGEASAMRNFMITRDGNLKKRPGTKPVLGLLQNYSVTVTNDVYKISEPYMMYLYPTISATSDGFFTSSGSKVAVNKGDFSSHLGEYWIRNGYLAYKLAGVADGVLIFSVLKVTSTDIDKSVKAIWIGTPGPAVACCGHLYSFYYLRNNTTMEITYHRIDIGTIDTSGDVHMFGFGGKLYILTETDYKVWDGNTLSSVAGYVPLVSVSVPPSGGGTTLEQVNKLSASRRAWFSPDGSAVTFKLPETGFTSVSAKLTADDTALTVSSSDSANGTVTLSAAPASGTNTVEITWTMPSSGRSDFLKMKYSELYNGSQDTRVFLYGDGTNKCIYSGLDYDGNPRADYFPDMNVLAVGGENTPIRAMIRHYSRLIVFKSASTWSISYGTINLEDNSTIAAFYATPINRELGCSTPGQARLVLNSPYVPFNNDLYEWKSNSSYTGNLTADERQARRISDRVYDTISRLNLPRAICFDDNRSQQYFIFSGKKALVHGYAVDAWYYYEGLDVTAINNDGLNIIIGGSDGYLRAFSEDYWSDDGKPIDCRWESGSMDFGASNMRKFSPTMWIGIKPEPQNDVVVTVQTDRKSAYSEKVVSSQIFSFDPADFGSWTFKNNDKPHMYRLKIKAKKFVFYKLIFETNTNNSGITVLAADIKVRYTGQAK